MRQFVLAGILAMASGCALLQKAEPIVPRYLEPTDPGSADGDRATPRPELELRLRRIRGSGHLGERVVLRDEQRVVFLEETRWTDPPPALVEERLAKALFERHGLTRIVGGAGVTLEVTVRAFEIVAGESPVARIELTVLLHDERRSLFQDTLVYEESTTLVDRDGRTEPGDDFPKAMGRALERASDAVADRVEETLGDRLADAEGAEASTP